METSNDNLIQNWTSNDLFINHEALEQAINNLTTIVKANNTINLTPNKIVIQGRSMGQNIITLNAEYDIGRELLEENDPNTLDQYVKYKLAQEIAKQLIDEDLIQIQVNDDPATLDKKVRAKIKIIQE